MAKLKDGWGLTRLSDHMREMAGAARAARAATQKRNIPTQPNGTGYFVPFNNPTPVNDAPPPGGNGGWDGGYAAAQAAAEAKAAAEKAKADKAAKDKTILENKATREAADAKFKLLSGYETARDKKLGNITAGLKASDKTLLANYSKLAKGLVATRADNDMSEADQTYANIANTIRERGDIVSEVASQGAGETDRLQAQLQALRNHDANQNDINRSFYDTLRGVNRSITGLNTETITGRKNIFDQAETDREAAWSNFYNQQADTWTEIFNIENQNQNREDNETTAKYNRHYTDAAKKAQEAVKGTYTKLKWDPKKEKWSNQAQSEDRSLTSNKAQVINIGGKMSRPEGATLRKW